MQKENMMQASMLDILFEGRNKAYGAYPLRRDYNKRLTKAVAVVMTLSAMVCASTLLAERHTTTGGIVISDSVILVEIPRDPIIPEPPMETPLPQQVATAQVTQPVILPDELVPPEDEVQEVASLDDKRIGFENVTGVPETDVIPQPLEAGTGLAVPIARHEEVDTIFRKVEIPAEFPGGMAGWRRYLERSLNYPEPAVDNGTQGNVSVQFVVDREGNISDVEALNDPGDGIAKEAVRIIKQGPKWQPAEQNGRKVLYRHVQSITFQLQ